MRPVRPAGVGVEFPLVRMRPSPRWLWPAHVADRVRPVDPALGRVGGRPGGGSVSGNDQVLIGHVFYLATCQDCRPLLAQPFTDKDERDQWMKAHFDATGHTIK